MGNLAIERHIGVRDMQIILTRRLSEDSDRSEGESD